MSLFLEAENRARTLPGLNRFRCNALVLRPVFQKGTGLVTSGPVAAATSGI